uniref:Uncharacterized protein n=1 Tax=Plectus sambesii TaxID=2011161 RepID=A0A914VUY5_9BILA
MASSEDQDDDVLLLALYRKVLSLSQAKTVLKQENDMLSSENRRLVIELNQRDQKIHELKNPQSHHQTARDKLEEQLVELAAEIERLKFNNRSQGNQAGLRANELNVSYPKRQFSVGNEPLNVLPPSLMGDRALSDAGVSKSTEAYRNRWWHIKQDLLQRCAQHKYHLQCQQLSTSSCDDNRPSTQLTDVDATLPDNWDSQWSLNGSVPDMPQFPILPQAYIDGCNKCLTDVEMTMLKTRIILQDSMIIHLQSILQAVNEMIIHMPGGMQLPVTAAMQPSIMVPQLQDDQQQMLPPFNMQLQQLQQQIIDVQDQSFKNAVSQLQPFMMAPHQDDSHGFANVSCIQSMSDSDSYVPVAMATMRHPDGKLAFAGMPAVAEVTDDSLLTHSLTPMEDSFDSDKVDSGEERFIEEQKML